MTPARAVTHPIRLGTFLRSFTFGHVRQLDRLTEQLLTRAWAAGAGPGDGPMTMDLDSTVCQVHGYHKQGAAYGYTHTLGYHPLVATRADTGEVLHARHHTNPRNALPHPSIASFPPAATARSVKRARKIGSGSPTKTSARLSPERRAAPITYRVMRPSRSRTENARWSSPSEGGSGTSPEELGGLRAARSLHLDWHTPWPHVRAEFRHELLGAAWAQAQDPMGEARLARVTQECHDRTVGRWWQPEVGDATARPSLADAIGRRRRLVQAGRVVWECPQPLRSVAKGLHVGQGEQGSTRVLMLRVGLSRITGGW
jgi:hypothetical protein